MSIIALIFTYATLRCNHSRQRRHSASLPCPRPSGLPQSRGAYHRPIRPRPLWAAGLDFDIVLEQDCQRVLEDAIVDENVDVYSLDMSGVVFRLMEKLEPALDDFTDLTLAATDSTASMGMFTFSHVFGMDECLGDLREEFDRISQFLWLQEDESRSLAFEAFREEFPEIELR